MDFAALYKSKLTTPEEAVKVVKSGDWVDYGWCTGTPSTRRSPHAWTSWRT